MISEESTWESSYFFNVEPLVESFESQSFDTFVWEFSGDANWTIEGSDFIGGSF